MEQIDLFDEFALGEHVDADLSSLDYVLVPEKGGYRLVHSYYKDSRLGTILSAEEAMKVLEFCATFNLYAVVAFTANLKLHHRKH